MVSSYAANETIFYFQSVIETKHAYSSIKLAHPQKKNSKYTIVITQRINNSGSPRYKESKTGSTEQPLLSDLPFSFNFLIALHTDGALKKILISLLLLLTSWLSSLCLATYLSLTLCWCICMWFYEPTCTSGLRSIHHKKSIRRISPIFFMVVLAGEQASALAISKTAVQYLYIRKLHLFFSYQL